MCLTDWWLRKQGIAFRKAHISTKFEIGTGSGKWLLVASQVIENLIDWYLWLICNSLWQPNCIWSCVGARYCIFISWCIKFIWTSGSLKDCVLSAVHIVIRARRGYAHDLGNKQVVVCLWLVQDAPHWYFHYRAFERQINCAHLTGQFTCVWMECLVWFNCVLEWFNCVPSTDQLCVHLTGQHFHAGPDFSWEVKQGQIGVFSTTTCATCYW